MNWFGAQQNKGISLGQPNGLGRRGMQPFAMSGTGSAQQGPIGGFPMRQPQFTPSMLQFRPDRGQSQQSPIGGFWGQPQFMQSQPQFTPSMFQFQPDRGQPARQYDQGAIRSLVAQHLSGGRGR